MPHSVTNIYSYAFRYCDKLKRIILPESLTGIYIESLSGVTNATVVFKGGAPKATTQCNALKFDPVEGIYSAKHAEEWDLVIKDGKWNGLPMRKFAATVTFNLGEHGTRTGGGELVQEICDFDGSAEVPEIQSELGWGFLGWDKSTDNIESNLVVNAVYEELICADPIVSPADGSTFRTNSLMVSIACATEGATIYYTTNGVTPKASTAILYTEPFEINATTVVKAIAVKENHKKGMTATAVITIDEPYTLAEGLGNTNLVFSVGGDAQWHVDEKQDIISASNDKMDDWQTSWISTTVVGPGSLGFSWKASCEEDPDGLCTWDHGEFWVDNALVTNIDGQTGWVEVRCALTEDSHILKWKYVKDGGDSVGGDALYIRGVDWIPDYASLLPDFGDSPTECQIAEALADSADGKLSAHIRDGKAYNAYRTWAAKVKGENGATIGVGAVKSAENSWLSFALGSERLIRDMPTDDDLNIDEFTSADEIGKFDFTVSVKDIEVGSEAAAENLKQVFGLEGGADLNALSSENVDIAFKTPSDGKVKFTAGPNAKNADAKTFFMKVRVKP